jgi:hypothetical protein
MEMGVRRPTVRPIFFGAWPEHERLPGGIHEFGAGHARTRNLCHRIGQVDRLEDSHGLAVNMDRARKLIETGLPLQEDDVKPCLAEHVGEQRARRPAADNRDIICAGRYGATCHSSPKNRLGLSLIIFKIPRPR